MTRLPPRSHAIDAMRGMTVALMIVVNMSISEQYSYAPLLHAVWHGYTLTDVVFPSFMFVSGTALAFTLGRLQAEGTAALVRKVLKRTALIFLCGYLLYWFPFVQFDAGGALALKPLSHTRIPGVLQRIALGYGAAVLILHFFKTRGALVFSLLALLGYWALLLAWGDLTLSGNAVLKLDLWVFGPDHLYHGEGLAFDPEGLLSTLPAIVNTLAGYFAGRFVIDKGNSFETLAKLLLAGALALGLAMAWSGVLPFNKKLWTPSYALCGIAIDLMVLAWLVYVIDMRGQRRWAEFFEIFGRNTLFIYLLSELLQTTMGLTHMGQYNSFDGMYFYFFRPLAGDKPGSLLYAVSFMLMCWAVAWWLDRRRIYIRL
jgi:predicted acyltransferase